MTGTDWRQLAAEAAAALRDALNRASDLAYQDAPDEMAELETVWQRVSDALYDEFDAHP